MICILRRIARIAGARQRRQFADPRTRSVPPVGSISRSRQRPSVVLPQPDSPTSPSVSPFSIVKADAVDRLHVLPGAPKQRRPAPGNISSGRGFRAAPSHASLEAGDAVAAARSRLSGGSACAQRRVRACAAVAEMTAGRPVERTWHHAREWPRGVRLRRTSGPASNSSSPIGVGMQRARKDRRQASPVRRSCRHTSPRPRRPVRRPRRDRA